MKNMFWNKTGQLNITWKIVYLEPFICYQCYQCCDILSSICSDYCSPVSLKTLTKHNDTISTSFFTHYVRVSIEGFHS